MGWANAGHWNQLAAEQGLPRLSAQERNLYYNVDGSPRGQEGRDFHLSRYGENVSVLEEGSKGYAGPITPETAAALGISSGGSSGSGGGGSRGFDISSYIGDGPPEAPSLEQYTGNSGRFDIDLTPGEIGAEATATRMLTDPNHNYQRALRGEADFAQLNKMMGIQERNFNLRQRPELERTLSASPYGNSGLSRREQMDAQLSLSDQHASMLFAEYERTKQEAIQSAQILPTITGVAGLSRNNEVNNLIRDMQIHFENQGLVQDEYLMQVQQWADQLAHAQIAMQAAGFGRGGGGRARPASLPPSLSSSGSGSIIGGLAPLIGAFAGYSGLLPGASGIGGAMTGMNLGGAISGYASGNFNQAHQATAATLQSWNAAQQ